MVVVVVVVRFILMRLIFFLARLVLFMTPIRFTCRIRVAMATVLFGVMPASFGAGKH